MLLKKINIEKNVLFILIMVFLMNFYLVSCKTINDYLNKNPSNEYSNENILKVDADYNEENGHLVLQLNERQETINILDNTNEEIVIRYIFLIYTETSGRALFKDEDFAAVPLTEGTNEIAISYYYANHEEQLFKVKYYIINP